jgi:hypothetical protein
MSTIETTGIIERIDHVRAFRQSDMSGAGDMAIISFDAQIGYLVSQSNRAHAEHGGEEIECISGYGDIGRFGACVTDKNTSVDDEVRRYCRRYAIGLESTLEVAVIAFQTVTPVLLKPDSIRSGSFGRKIYTLVPEDWSSNEASLQAMIKWESGASRERPIDHGGKFKEFIRAKAVIWRSNWTEEQNIAARSAYIHDHIEPVIHSNAQREIHSQKMLG